jgi:hypothetical protein
LRTAIALLWLVLQPVIFHWNALIARKAYLPWDLPGYHVPLMTGVAEALSQRRLPLWEPYTYAGYPLHANSQAQILYPLAWPVFAKAALGQAYRLFYWLEWETVLHISIAGLLTWWLLRRAGCDRWPALFGATAYQFGCFFTSQVQHLGAVCAAAWMPLAWLAVMELAQNFSAGWLAALAAALALSFLSGFAAMTLVVYGSAVALALGLWITRRARIHILLWTAIGILASIPLLAAQLVPTALWTVHSQASLRWMWTPVEGISPRALLSSLWPNWFHVFTPATYKEPDNLTFMYLYHGQAALWLALAAPWLRTRLPARLFAALALLFALVMFGGFTPGYQTLFHLLPHALQGAVYINFVLGAFSLAVTIAAAFALNHLASGRRTWLAAAVALGTGLELWKTGAKRPMNTTEGDWKMVDSPRMYFERDSILPQLHKWFDATTPPLRTDTMQDEYRFATPAPAIRIQSLSGDDPFAPLRGLQYRRLFAEGADWVRRYPVVDPGSPLLFAANVGFLLQAGDLPNESVLRAAGWEEMAWDPGLPLHVFHNRRVMPRYYLVPEVRTAASAEAARDLLKNIDPHRTAVVEGAVDCHPVAGAAPPPVEVVSYRPGRVELRATLSSPAYLVAAESWAPGWQAHVNGRPAAVYPTNLAFQGVMLGAGRQDIVLEYVPTSAYVAFGISVASWLALACRVGFSPS